jgi:hypothetical protein
MADLNDLLQTLVGIIGGAVYPNGMGQLPVNGTCTEWHIRVLRVFQTPVANSAMTELSQIVEGSQRQVRNLRHTMARSIPKAFGHYAEFASCNRQVTSTINRPTLDSARGPVFHC